MIKHRFIATFKNRFLLRFHMSLILISTMLTGALWSELLLMLNVDNMMVRYPLVVLCSYLVFFLLIKLWLKYISAATVRGREDGSSGFDILDIVELPSTGGRPPTPHIKWGGGKSGGGGASASFDGGAQPPGTAPLHASLPTDETGASTALDAAGDTAGGVSEEGAVPLIVLGLVIAAIFGAAVYLVYAAPAILAEAAFEALLATSLVRVSKRMDQPDWMGSVFRATAFPFEVTIGLALLVAACIHSYWPEATKLADIFK